MTYRGLEKFYLWSIRTLFFIIPFLPLYVSGIMFFPFITGRNFAFRILVEAAFILWLGLIALSYEYRPRFSKIYAAVLFFAAVVFLADLFGANFYHSFWANFERMEGYLMIFHMTLFFIIATSVFRKKDWNIFAHLVIFASVLVGFYALFQKLGFLISIQGGFRVDGTIGNPAYLAAYLMFVSFIVFLFFWNTTKKWLRYFYGAIIIFELILVYFTATRGVILALLSGGIVFLTMYLWMNRKSDFVPYKKLALGILFLLIITPGAFFIFRKASFIQHSPVLSRFSSISPTERTTQSRFIIWSMAWEGVKEHPFLGWGQENFNLVFNKYYDPRLWRQEPWFDRSHNIIFDWLSNAGIVGLLSYLSLFAISLRLLYGAYKKNKVTQLTFITITVAFASYFFQNLFVFDNFNSYFIFFGFLSFIHFLDTQEEEFGAPVFKNQKGVESGQAMARSLSIVSFVVLLMALGMYIINIRPLQQSTKIIESLHFAGRGAQPLDVLQSYKKTLAYNAFGNAEAREQFLQYASNIVGVQQIPAKDRETIMREAVHEMELQTEKSPNDIRYMLFLASVGYSRLAQFDSSYVLKAEEQFLKIIQLSPKKQQSYLGLIQLYINTGHADKALQYAKIVRDLDSTYPEGQLFVAISGIFASQFDEAAQAVREYQALRNSPNDIQHILDAYGAVQRFDAMAPLYEDLIRRFPDKAEYRARLAAIYQKLGMYDAARDQVNQAIRLDPENYRNEGETFLKQLSP